MNVIQTIFDGVILLEPRVFGDERGYFFESWNRERLRGIGVEADFIQDNESMSSRGVFRGLHYQLPPYSQAKLVRVVRGGILDVVVDIRRGSPTFGRHVKYELTGENKRQIFIPRGFAHGFVCLADDTVLSYKCDRPYMPSHERGINPGDPFLGIDFGLDVRECIVSAKDAKNPLLAAAEIFDYARRGEY